MERPGQRLQALDLLCWRGIHGEDANQSRATQLGKRSPARITGSRRVYSNRASKWDNPFSLPFLGMGRRDSTVRAAVWVVVHSAPNAWRSNHNPLRLQKPGNIMRISACRQFKLFYRVWSLEYIVNGTGRCRVGKIQDRRTIGAGGSAVFSSGEAHPLGPWNHSADSRAWGFASTKSPHRMALLMAQT